MNNAEKFQEIFELCATEMWEMSVSEFLEWMNSEYTSTNTPTNTPTNIPTNTPTDLISRQAAIEAFDGVKVNENDCTEYDIGYNDGIDFAVSKLSVLPSAQPKNARKRTETHACDCISRQEVLRTLHDWVYEGEYKEIADLIESLPPVEDMGEVSDGYHTFNQLYHQRAVLFATIVNQNKDKAWKSWKHEDGKFCFDKGGEWFIVGIDTPEGSYTYHYEKKYWELFDCEELDRGKHWDGHTEDDVARLLSLPPVEPKRPKGECEKCHNQKWIKAIENRSKQNRVDIRAIKARLGGAEKELIIAGTVYVRGDKE